MYIYTHIYIVLTVIVKIGIVSCRLSKQYTTDVVLIILFIILIVVIVIILQKYPQMILTIIHYMIHP